MFRWSDSHVIRWSSTSVRKHLPLAQGAIASIPFFIRAVPECSAVQLTVSYSHSPQRHASAANVSQHDTGQTSTQSNTDHASNAAAHSTASTFHRECVRTVQWQVSAGLRVLNMDIRPSTGTGTDDAGVEVGHARHDSDGQPSGSPIVSPEKLRPTKPLVDTSMLVLEVENTSGTTFSLYCEQWAPSDFSSDSTQDTTPDRWRRVHRSNGVFVEKYCRRRIILPLRRFSFGTQLDKVNLRIPCAPCRHSVPETHS